MRGVVLGGHGLFTWGPTAKDCYRTTLEMINRRPPAGSSANARGEPPSAASASRPCRGPSGASSPRSSCRPFASAFRAASARSAISPTRAAVLEFVNSRDSSALAALGTSCPDHFLRTKIRPLVLPFDPAARQPRRRRSTSLDERSPTIAPTTRPTTSDASIPDSPPMRDPNRGHLSGPGRRHAVLRQGQSDRAHRRRVLCQCDQRDARRIAASAAMSGCKEQEAFDIEYWLLEEAKLQRMPKPKSLAGRVALVTGGAGGIGQAIARAADWARAPASCSPISTRRALMTAVADFGKRFGKDLGRRRSCRRDDEPAVEAAFRETLSRYGGIDICRRQCGHRLGRAVRGHFARALEPQHRHPRDRLFPCRARAGYRIMKDQGLGGAIVFIASKNALAASPGRVRLLHRQGGGGSSCALPRARRRAPWHPRQYGQSGRGAARLQDLAGRMADAARRVEQGRARMSSKRSTASARC